MIDPYICELSYQAETQCLAISQAGPSPFLFERGLDDVTPADRKAAASETEIAQLKDAWEEERAQFQKLIEDARAEGYATAESDLAEARKMEHGLVQESIRAVQAAKDRYLAAIEGEVVELALEVAAHVLRRETEVNRMSLAAAVADILRAMDRTTAVTLRVPAMDIDAWSRFTNVQTWDGPEVTVQGDALLKTGECQCHVHSSWIDLGIDAQMCEIRNKLRASQGKPESQDA